MTEITGGNIVKFATKTLFVTIDGNAGVQPADTTLFTNEVEIIGMTVADSGDLNGSYNTAVSFRNQDGTLLAVYSPPVSGTLVVSNPAFWNFTSLLARTVTANGPAWPINTAWLTIYYRETG